MAKYIADYFMIFDRTRPKVNNCPLRMFQALHRCSVAVDFILFRKSQSWNLYLYILIYINIKLFLPSKIGFF